MDFFLEGLQQAWDMIAARDPYLVHLVEVTLWVALVSTAIALAIGLPFGLLLGLGRFRGRGVMVTFANAGLGLPPVVVGLVLALLMFPAAPLGRFHLLFTLEGVLIAQTLLALPIIVALSCASIREISPGLIIQARAFGAGRIQVSVLALREARVGILAATIAAVGSGLSEVGAVVLVGGNIQGVDQTLASAALQQVEAGHFAQGLAIGILLLGLILVVVALLTVLQMAGSARRVGASS
ncbi:ABC transporter permease [Nocardioides hungaricus]|jgi:tungstate transport system permease protein